MKANPILTMVQPVDLFPQTAHVECGATPESLENERKM